MANLKRRPDKDLNHDNWDQDEAAEEKGEFKRAGEDDLRGRRMLVPRRKIIPSGSGGGGATVSSNPFSAFAFGAPATSAPIFGIPMNPIGSTSSTIPGTVTADGGTGSLFKLAGITPSSEPPTKASADSSTADTPGGSSEASASGIRQERQPESEPEVGSISESEGITEESSNSSSLPWNVSSRQQEKEAAEERAGADSMQNLKVRSGDKDMNNWADEDEPEAEEKGEFSKTSNEAMQSGKELTPNRKIAQTATAPADSSESSSASNPNPSNNPFAAFSFGNTFGSGTTLFRPFASASATVSQSAQSAIASTVPTSSASAAEPSQPQASGDTRSPESSGILIRSSIEEDSADYENDTTSSSNKLLMSENEVSNDYQEGGASGGADQNREDREAEAEANEEREADGVDS